MEVPSARAEFVNVDREREGERERERQTDMTKRMVAVCNFANVPRNGVHYHVQLSYNVAMYRN